MLKISFKTDSAAFENREVEETVRLLKAIVSKLESGREDGSVMDLNGNKIGSWEYWSEQEKEAAPC